MAAPPAESPPLPEVTIPDVERLADHASFERGQRYRRRGMIFRPIRRGAALSAGCRGSSGGPYEVRLTLGASGKETIAGWSCTCPLGTFCKHVVALALTWIEDPDAFETRRTVEELLAGQDRDGLVAIIQKLIALDPSLEAKLEKAIPPAPVVIAPAKPGEAAVASVSAAEIRRTLNLALDGVDGEDEWDGGGWGSERDDRYDYDGYDDEVDLAAVEAAFAEAVAAGERYEQAGRLADAATIYGVVASTGTSRFEDTYESEVVQNHIHAAARSLVRILERQAELPRRDRLPPPERIELLIALYEVWLFVGHGHWEEIVHADGTFHDAVDHDELPGPDQTEAILAALTDEERAFLDRRWRAEAADTGIEEWRRRSALAFGVAMSGPDGPSDEEILALIINAELWHDQAAFLIDRGRYVEAVAVAARKLVEPGEALTFAKLLAATGDEGRELAIRFVDERLWESEGKNPHADELYRRWLAEELDKAGKVEAALDLHLRGFKANPDFWRYQALEQAATRPGIDPARWPALRKAAIKTLKEKGNRSALMQIALAEGNAKEALALLNEAERAATRPGEYWSYGLHGFREQVAKLAEREFPDEAIRLYRQLADQLIANKQRGSYQQAVPHLAAIKRILEAAGRAGEWQTLIRTLREEHRRLPALQQELDLAGLRP